LSRVTDSKMYTQGSRDHSVRNGIQIFSVGLESDEKSKGSIDQRHKRISSVPKSILSKQTHSKSKDRDILTASTNKQKLSEEPKAYQDSLVSPARNVLYSAQDVSTQSHIKSGSNISNKSRIDDLLPEERYRHGERLG